MAISIDKQMDRLRARKAELQRELEQLEKIESDLEKTIEDALRTIGAAASGAVSGARGAVRSQRRSTARKSTARKRTATKGGAGRRGRPKGSGKRQSQAVKIIASAPGIRTSEVAKKMGIGPNYLYRLLPDLATENLIVKRGSGWYPAGDGSKPAAPKPASPAKKAAKKA